MEELKRLYNENTSFKHYVDKYVHCMRTSCTTVSEALEHATVRNVAEYYMEEGKHEQSPTTYGR